MDSAQQFLAGGFAAAAALSTHFAVLHAHLSVRLTFRRTGLACGHTGLQLGAHGGFFALTDASEHAGGGGAHIGALTVQGDAFGQVTLMLGFIQAGVGTDGAAACTFQAGRDALAKGLLVEGTGLRMSAEHGRNGVMHELPLESEEPGCPGLVRSGSNGLTTP